MLDHVVVVDLLEHPRLVDGVAYDHQDRDDHGEGAHHHRHAVVLLEADVQWHRYARPEAYTAAASDLGQEISWRSYSIEIITKKYLLGENLPISIWKAWK